MSLLTAFNTQLINFIEELIELFPDDLDFKVFKNATLILKKNVSLCNSPPKNTSLSSCIF